MSRHPFRYRAFGLAIDSDFAFEELESRDTGRCDLVIRAAPVESPQTPFDGFRHHEVRSKGDVLSYRDVGNFLVCNGVIDVDVDRLFDQRLLGLPLLGPVMACHLHRENFLVLHGSAVAIDGKAHVFLGDKGAGKSTTAAALVAAGFPLVADDVVAIERRENGELAVRAAYPAMKLDAEMMAAFPPRSCNVLEPDEGLHTAGKSRVRLNGLSCSDAVPLHTVHCLTRGASTKVQPLPTAQILHALIRFSHHPRLGPAANTPSEAAGLFAIAARYAPSIRADILTVKDSLADVFQLGAFLSCKPRCDAAAA